MHLIPHESRWPGVHPSAPAVGFPIWQTITLGTHKTVIELAQAAKDADCWVIDSALVLMAQPAFTLAPRETEIDLVAVSAGELGFTSATPRAWIYERARQLGLQLCPAEVGPQLLRQHPEQLDDLLLSVAMEPIVDPRGRPGGFILTNCNGKTGWWLLWGPNKPAAVCLPGRQLVFVLPRQYGADRRVPAAVRHFSRH